MKIEFGKCPYCEKEIMKEEKNNSVMLKGYSTFWVLLSNSSRMKVAICEDCKKTLNDKKVEELIAAHQEFWTQGIENTLDAKIEEIKKQKEENVNYYTSLTALKFGLRERDLE